jgi:hypothetical protein
MTEPACCPYCGCPRESPLDSLYREVARIREIAERSGAVGNNAQPGPQVPEPREPADQSAGSAARIAELTREVHELRTTVARLRGSALPGLARSA